MEHPGVQQKETTRWPPIRHRKCGFKRTLLEVARIAPWLYSFSKTSGKKKKKRKEKKPLDTTCLAPPVIVILMPTVTGLTRSSTNGSLLQVASQVRDLVEF